MIMSTWKYHYNATKSRNGQKGKKVACFGVKLAANLLFSSEVRVFPFDKH